MKIVFFIFLLLTENVFAGILSTYAPQPQIQSSFENFYYHPVLALKSQNFFNNTPKLDKTKAIDIIVYNATTDQTHYIFAKKAQEEVLKLIFEVDYDAKRKSIAFNRAYSSYILNNREIPERALKNQLLIFTYSEKEQLKKLWLANRNGKELKLLMKFPPEATWHIDVKNNQIRTFYQKGLNIEIQIEPW